LAQLALLSCVACGGDDTVLAGRAYSPVIPRDALLGLWAPESRTPTLLYSLFGGRRPIGPETLAVRGGGSCELSPALAQRLIDCQHAYTVEAEAKVPCAWRIEGTSNGESLHVQFQDAERMPRVAPFVAYRRQADGDVALAWTCTVGDARGLFHQGTLAP
jgi:hypothetical protein